MTTKKEKMFITRMLSKANGGSTWEELHADNFSWVDYEEMKEWYSKHEYAGFVSSLFKKNIVDIDQENDNIICFEQEFVDEMFENTLNQKNTKVLWFSRHEMTQEQKQALENKLGEIEINQVNKTIRTAYELQEEIKEADIVAIVAPVNLQQQFLKIAENRPVITAISDRIITKQEDGSEDKVTFQFNRWEQIKKIEVVTELFAK